MTHSSRRATEHWRDGNNYRFLITDDGTATFEHHDTGEHLHGRVGPWREAWDLYVSTSEVLTTSEPRFGFMDCGMGCGAQLLAYAKALCVNPHLSTLDIASFDLEKDGLEALWKHQDDFPYAQEFSDLLKAMLESDTLSWSFEGGKTLNWTFYRGDALVTLPKFSAHNPLWADSVSWDFFSPKSHPHLWTMSAFESLLPACRPTCRVITYSSATIIRSALLAAGFCVGLNTPSGQKAMSTMASPLLSALPQPLPLTWKATFERSHARIGPGESEESGRILVERVLTHRQFRDPSQQK